MWRVLVPLVVVLALAGCGDDPAPKPPAAVELTILDPADAATVDAESVSVRGAVRPAEAEVHVRGRKVDVTGGSFTAEVELDEGANLIDVSAAATGRRPVSTAVRVVREVPVEIPDLVGSDAQEAIDALEELRLVVERTQGGGLLDDLLPGAPEVCALDPEPGTKVKPGAKVTVEVARSC